LYCYTTADDTMMVDRLQKEVKRLRSLLVEYANAAGEGGGVVSGGGGGDLENGEGGEGGGGNKGVGGLLATVEEKLEASEEESRRLRDRVRSLEEALKTERDQRRHLSRGWEEEKRGMTLQHKEALAAAEARGMAAAASVAGDGGFGGGGGGVASSPTRGGLRSSGGVGAVAAARAARADAAASSSGGESFSMHDRFGSSASYAHKAPGGCGGGAGGGGGRLEDSPYAAGFRASAGVSKATSRVTASADGGANGRLQASHSSDSLQGSKVEGGGNAGEAPDEAWGGSDAGQIDAGEWDGSGPPRRPGGGWGRSSILGAARPELSPEPPEQPSTSRRGNSPKKQQAKKPKKLKPAADDLGSWMYILGASRSSLQARNMANTGLLQQMHARMDAQDDRRRNAEKNVADAVGGYAHLVNNNQKKMISDGAGGTAGISNLSMNAGGAAPGGYSAAAGQTWGRSAVLPTYGGAGEVEGDLTVEETSPQPVKKTWGRSSLLSKSTAAPAGMSSLSEGAGGQASAATSDSGRSADENLVPAAGGAGASGGGVTGSSPTPRRPETPPPAKAWGRSALLAEKVNGTTPTLTATATAGA
jgi:hypothetical protein